MKGLALKPSSDRKVRNRKTQKNTFGLSPGINGTCPAATIGCGGCMHAQNGKKLPTCYVYPLMSAFPGVSGVLEHNTKLLMLSDLDGMVDLLTREFERFQQQESRSRNGGRHYRLHWSGDIFNQDYAYALGIAMQKFPDIQFWTYTRSFHYGVMLAERTPNLITYLSLDKVNVYPGLRCYFDNRAGDGFEGRLRIAYMSSEDNWKESYQVLRASHETMRVLDKQEGKKVHKKWPKRPPVLCSCPVDSGRMEIESGCHRCGICIKKEPRNVWFQV